MSAASNRRSEPESNVYWLRGGGTLDAYVNVAPGVHLPMCLWSAAPPFECVLPEGHDGPHYLMEREEADG